jgi:hypothetical protein
LSPKLTERSPSPKPDPLSIRKSEEESEEEPKEDPSDSYRPTLLDIPQNTGIQRKVIPKEPKRQRRELNRLDDAYRAEKRRK